MMGKASDTRRVGTGWSGMKWLVGVVIVVMAAAAGTSTAIALDARSQVHHLRSVSQVSDAPSSLAAQVEQLRRRLARDERPVNGDDPRSATTGNFTGLQQDVHDLGSIIQQYGGGQGEPQIRKVVNELIAICRGSAGVYEDLRMAPPNCPDDL